MQSILAYKKRVDLCGRLTRAPLLVQGKIALSKLYPIGIHLD